MSKVLVTDTHLSDIGDAIREKLGVATTYRPGDMAAAIGSISGGGYPEPTGTIEITANGTVNVKDYASANVNVQGGGADVLMAKQGDTLCIAIPADGEYGPMSSAEQYIVPLMPDGVTPAKLDLSQPYEIGCTFKIPSASGNGLNVWGSSNSYYYCPTISIRSNRFQYNLSTNGSSWAYNTYLSDIAVPTDTYIFARVSFDGSNTTFFVDTGEETASITLEGVANYYNPDYGFEFGGQNKSAYSIAGANATLKMADTYLKQGDTVIWGGGSGSGGGSVLITKTITQNGTYNASADNADGYSQVVVNVQGGGTSDEILYNHDFTLNTTGQTTWDATNSGTSASSRKNIIDGWNIMQCTAEIVSNGLKIVPKKAYAYLTCQIPPYWFNGKRITLKVTINGIEYSQTGTFAASGASINLSTPFGTLYCYGYSASDNVFTITFINQIDQEFIVSAASMKLATT